MKKELAGSILISLIFLSLGFLLLHYELVGYGLSFFVFLPFIVGYVSGGATVRKISLIGIVISLAIFFILLIVGGLEGMVCILMAMPLVLGAIALGASVKYLLNKNRKKHKSDNLMKSSLLPIGLFLFFGFVEKAFQKDLKETISVRSEIILPYSCLEVYEAIKSVDTLVAEKPWLMKLDLPVPTKCILEKEEVGGCEPVIFLAARLQKG